MLSLPDPTRHFNRIHNTDALDFFKSLPDQSVQTIVTSPPYYGLRDYGVDGQLGLEDTPQAYIERLVGIFDAARRVLRDDGTLWVNLGDSYSGGGTHHGDKNVSVLHRGKDRSNGQWANIVHNIPAKNMLLIPESFALAMRDEGGWIVRNDIIWHKANPMPESVKDRCTNAHEHIYLFSKNPRYYCNMDAIREPVTDSTVKRLSQDIDSQEGSSRANGGLKSNGNMKAVAKQDQLKKRTYTGFNDRYFNGDPGLTRNKRDVWTVSTKPYSGAHFAVFPPDLIEPCILAGAPPGGVVCDPFMGSGTTAMVAIKHKRQWVGCELNADYIELAHKRLSEPLQIDMFTSAGMAV